MPRLLGVLEQEVSGYITDTSPSEPFAKREPDAYFASAQWAMNRIRLALLAARKEDLNTILDLPCGFGRVLRMLKAGFPNAQITACDIDKEAVDFCAATFDAIPVYSTQDPDKIPIRDTFDLIWCGSLLTHVDEVAWEGFLRFFASLLAPGGILVFTALGPFVADEQLHGPNPYGLGDDQVKAIVTAYRQTGFGYCDYQPKEWHRRRSLPLHYGIALASPSWVCSRLEATGHFDLLTYTAGGWGTRWGAARGALATAAQDFVGCIRVDG